jgi:hypothetical protein
MKWTASSMALPAIAVAVALITGTSYQVDVSEDPIPAEVEPWEVIFEVEGEWALALQVYNGKLYLGERNYYTTNDSYIYESPDGENFTKVFATGCVQTFIMGVNELDNTLNIGTLYRIGQGRGMLFSYDGTSFSQVPDSVWWNGTTTPGTPLSMEMYQNKFYIGGLSWATVPETRNKMWVKYQDQMSQWHWTDMDQARVGLAIEAYSMGEFNDRLFVGTFEPAMVVEYDPASDMWNRSLDPPADGALGNDGIIDLVNYSGELHGLTWRSGYHWIYDGASWRMTDISRYGNFGRAIVQDDYLYAGSSADYGGIPGWESGNFSRFDGVDWVEVKQIDTVAPLYFTKFQGYIYATAGKRVYRRPILYSPIISDPPKNVNAKLEGSMYDDVNITWGLSNDDSLVVNYSVFSSVNYRLDKQGYQFLGSVPGGADYFVHANAGHGDGSNYFYYVQAFGPNNSLVSAGQSGKFTRPVSAGWQLLSIPLLQQDSKFSSVFATIGYDRIWTYERSNGGGEWKCYNPEKGWSFDSFDIQRAYWVEVMSPGQLTVAGKVLENPVVSLRQGWNLVSFLSFDAYDVATVVAETGATRVEELDPMSPPFYLKEMTGPTVLNLGEGYWINVPSDIFWVLS